MIMTVPISVYRQTCNIERILVGNGISSIACRRCFNYIFILDLSPGFNRLDKYNCKKSREASMF